MTSTSLLSQLTALAANARVSSRALMAASTAQKNAAIQAIADALEEATPALLAANENDIQAAAARDLPAAMVDRLRLTVARVKAMADGAREVALLPDPVGTVIDEHTRPNGIHIIKRRVPIGVVGIIYESRPNVTCDAAVLCLKTGNAAMLRGGSEAFHSNAAIAAVMSQALAGSGLPAGAVSFVPTTSREAVPLLCSLDKFIDVIVPRGGHSLIEAVVQHARMPVIKHYNGICHIFVEREADFAMAEKIIVNAKCQRPSACNAVETLLVDREIAATFLPKIIATLQAQNVEIRADGTTQKIVSGLKPATEADWETEHLDLILNVRVVDGTEAAIAHIEAHGSHHSDAIITANAKTAECFLAAVDSATIYWNASTRFTDGKEFGFGAEIGISTDKFHARGPMGLEELTTYKYQILGTGQIRE